MTIPTLAYAIKIDGKIDPRTVFTTRRGAIINWIYSIQHIIVLDRVPAEQVFEYWELHKGNAECVTIEIIEVKKGSVAL